MAVLDVGFRGSLVCRRRRSHATARRCFFRRPANRATSLADVLRAVHRVSILLPGTTKSFSCFLARGNGMVCTGLPPTAIDDFLAFPSSLHKHFQENVDITRRCSPITSEAWSIVHRETRSITYDGVRASLSADAPSPPRTEVNPSHHSGSPACKQPFAVGWKDPASLWREDS